MSLGFKERSTVISRWRWLALPTFLLMIVSAIYLILYVRVSFQVGYTGVENHLRYWLVFPYNNTYILALLAGVIFLACIIFLTLKLLPVATRKLVAIFFPVFSILTLLLLCGYISLLSLFANVDHLDSVIYETDTFHLAYKNNFEYGPSFYLFKCDRRTFYCENVAHFFPYGTIVSDDQANLAKLKVESIGLLIVTYEDKT